MEQETYEEVKLMDNRFANLRLCFKNINFCGIREKCRYKYFGRCIGSLAKNDTGYKEDCTCVINERLRDEVTSSIQY